MMRPARVKIARIVVFIIFLLSFLELCIFEMKGRRREVGKAEEYRGGEEEMGEKTCEINLLCGS